MYARFQSGHFVAHGSGGVSITHVLDNVQHAQPPAASGSHLHAIRGDEPGDGRA